LPNKPAYQTSRFLDQKLFGPAGELLRPATFGKATATPNRALAYSKVECTLPIIVLSHSTE